MANKDMQGALLGLRAVNALAEEVNSIVRRTVLSVKADGATWEQIGQALGGLTKQAAFGRYGRYAQRQEEATDV